MPPPDRRYAICRFGKRDRAVEVGRSLLARLGDDTAAATRRGLAHLWLARAAAATARWDEVSQQLDLARGEVAIARDEQLGCRVDALDALAALGQEDLEHSSSMAGRALAAAERLGVPEVMCEALEAIGRCYRPFDLAAAEAAFQRAHRIAEQYAANALADKFPWARYDTVIDVGTAEGCVPVQLALRHPHLTAGGFDLPPVEPIFADYVASFGLGDRLRFHAGDFFVDALPPADVFVFGHILHDWDLDQRLTLLARAHAALPDGGAVIVYDAIIDDDRRTNAFGLLMSLLMLLETDGGANHTAADCRTWMEKVGFCTTYTEPLVGPDSMVVGIK